jgi:hypothetical protein
VKHLTIIMTRFEVTHAAMVRPGSGEIKGSWAINGAQSGDLPLQFRHPNVFDVLCWAEGRLCEAMARSSDL